jgi:cob(I)alamin adenosyltransferase
MRLAAQQQPPILGAARDYDVGRETRRARSLFLVKYEAVGEPRCSGPGVTGWDAGRDDGEEDPRANQAAEAHGRWTKGVGSNSLFRDYDRPPMKIYTKTGDDGTTGLFGGARVKKASPRVEAYGTVDELNATLGVARALGLDAQCEAVLAQSQVDLFTLGAELACVPGKESKLAMALIDDKDAQRLERAIDEAEIGLPPLKNFVLPGGSAQAASLHHARTVCRRAERAILALDDAPARAAVVIYLNRLSDLLFTLARRENHVRSVADVPWAPRAAK